MARKYDYEVISLDRAPTSEHVYQWCCKHHHTSRAPVTTCDLGHLLDELGAQGWHVVTATSDGRFGNQIVLERETVDDAGPEPDLLLGPLPKSGGMSDAAAGAIISEMKALRKSVEAQASAFSGDLLSQALQPLFGQIKDALLQRPEYPWGMAPLSAEAVAQAVAAAIAPIAERASAAPAPVWATLDESTVARLETIASRPLPEAPPARAIMDSAALAGLEEALRRALPTPPTHVSIAPEAFQRLESVIERAVDRTPPAAPPGPATAILDPAALSRLEAAIQRAATPISVSASATFSPEAAGEIQAAFDAAVRALPAPQVHLGRDLLAGLEQAVLQATARPQDAVLTPESTAAMRQALTDAVHAVAASLPAPNVSAVLDPGSIERLERAVLRAPEMTTLREALVQFAASLERSTVALSPETVAELEEALRRAVAPPVEAVSVQSEPERKGQRKAFWSSWMPRALGRWQWSFGK